MARALSGKSEPTDATAAVALAVAQSWSSPLNSLRHHFSDPQKTAFSFGNEAVQKR